MRSKSVTVTPATITAAGLAANLDALDALYADTSVDVTGASSSFTAQIRVRQPSELTYLSSNSGPAGGGDRAGHSRQDL